LSPVTKCDVARAAARPQRVEQVADHGRVDSDVLGFVRLPRPGRDEHRVGAKFGQRRCARAGVLQIRCDRENVGVGGRAAREAMDRPAFADQEVGGGAADDAAGAHYQCRLGHHHAPIRGSTAQARLRNHCR